MLYSPLPALLAGPERARRAALHAGGAARFSVLESACLMASATAIDYSRLTRELGIDQQAIARTVALLDEGNTRAVHHALSPRRDGRAR